MPVSYFLQTLGLILCALSTAMMLALSWAILWGIERGQAPGVESAPALGPGPGRRQAGIREAVGAPARLKRMAALPPGYHRGVRHKRKGRRGFLRLEMAPQLRAAAPVAVAMIVVWLIWMLMGGLARVIANGGGDWLIGVSQWIFPR
jgi:hypothetical protein